MDEDGKPFDDRPLRSFAELEVGVLIEYEIEPYFHQKHGESYTIHKPRANTTQRVAHLEKVIEGMGDQISALEDAVARAGWLN